MCGRFVFFETEAAMKRFHADPPGKRIKPRYNAAPAQDLPVVVRNSPNRIEFMRWGLVPFWAKDEKISYRMINARVETVADKPSYRRAFKRQRCIVPANGFYEWQNLEKAKQKVPYFFHQKNNQLFGMAELWEEWKHEGAVLHSFTILTTQAKDAVAKVHDRMPVILRPQDETDWLDPEIEDKKKLKRILQSHVSDLSYHRVQTTVNNPRHEGPELITEAS